MRNATAKPAALTSVSTIQATAKPLVLHEDAAAKDERDERRELDAFRARLHAQEVPLALEGDARTVQAGLIRAGSERVADGNEETCRDQAGDAVPSQHASRPAVCTSEPTSRLTR